MHENGPACFATPDCSFTNGTLGFPAHSPVIDRVISEVRIEFDSYRNSRKKPLFSSSRNRQSFLELRKARCSPYGKAVSAYAVLLEAISFLRSMLEAIAKQ